MDKYTSLFYYVEMTTELSLNINDECARIIRWGEIERGRSVETIIFMGVKVLEMIDNADEVYLVNRDGEKERIHTISPEIPSEIYDI
jgi:hypothetical protein